ncbi:MAG: IS200/IS605 family transposase [Nitrososphaerota archaeon]|jgi:putative transposase|nr:IS200/IS605 family transposase [Nitrososphaerota archaeon]MDG6964856.1 IS200/IS605 family transposase [Nitrososphaerota archaeon]
MDQYRRARHSVYLANYHLVWIPKRRKPVLVGPVKVRLEQLLKEIADERGWTILEMSVQPDHVHLFVSADTKAAIHEVVNAFKGRTSHDLREEFPSLLRLPSLWTHSYFASTAGHVSSETIKKYIQEQSKS